MPIAIRVMTVVIKKRALAVRYPGGVSRFQADHPGPADDHLVGVRYMSGGDVAQLLDLLATMGFDLPSCVAIGDVHLGPMDTCPGIEFYTLTPDAPFDKNWYAAAVVARPAAAASNPGN